MAGRDEPNHFLTEGAAFLVELRCVRSVGIRDHNDDVNSLLIDNEVSEIPLTERNEKRVRLRAREFPLERFARPYRDRSISAWTGLIRLRR